MAVVYYNLYQNFIQGSVSYYGNSLGLAKAAGTLTPGTQQGMGTFITVDTTLQTSASWPMGTTTIVANNSSDAYVYWETGSTVEAAHLMWSAGYQQATGGSAIAGYPIWIQDPTGTKTILVADHSILNSHATIDPIYFNSVDVTTIVKNAGEGHYIVGSIPCQMVANPNATIYQMAGWCLAVVYKNKQFPLGYCYVILTNQDAPGGGGAPYNIFIPLNGTTPMKFCAAFLGAQPSDGGYGFGFFSGYTLPPPYNDPYNVISDPWRPNTANQFCNFAGGVVDKYDGSAADYSGIFGDRVNSLVSPITIKTGGRIGMDIINKNTYATPRTQIQLDVIQNSYAVSFGYIALVNNAMPTLTKTVDKGLATSGDVILYTLNLILYTASNGTGDANNVVIYDTIPQGTTLVPGSVYKNGINIPGANPQSGISIGYVTLPYSVTINYSVTVNSPVTTTSITNEFYAVYGATIPSPTIPVTNILIMSNAYSNQVVTSIPPLSISKYVDKNYADISDIITYNIQVSAIGSSLSNVIVYDTLPVGYSVISGSLQVNGINNPGDLSSGINIGNIPNGGVTTITFKINTPSSIPVPNTIVNFAMATDDAGDFSTSNIVTTTINSGQLESVKVASKEIGTINDTIIYTVTIVNVGNQPSSNVIFIDTIPTGASFINGSVTLNNTSLPSAIVGLPGINIGTIPGNSIATITFAVTIVSIPAGNLLLNSAYVASRYYVDPSIPMNYSTISNIALTTVSAAIFDVLSKAVDKNYATTGDTISYTITTKNSGNVDAINCIYLDTLSNGIVYVPGTLFINGTPNASLPTSINLGTIGAGEYITINFICKIN